MIIHDISCRTATKYISDVYIMNYHVGLYKTGPLMYNVVHYCRNVQRCFGSVTPTLHGRKTGLHGVKKNRRKAP